MRRIILVTRRTISHSIVTQPTTRTMATATKVHLSTDADGQRPEFFCPGITSDQAKKATENLQENHERHHIFFHPDGLHNHIVHYQLAILALNASTTNLQKAYERSKPSQRQMPPIDNDVLHNLHEPETFMKHLSVKDGYATWLKFFQMEMEKSGWEDVLQRYLFAGDEQADALLLRMYAGFLHPIIHLGYGVEFQQPAIIAEALAQAACSDGWIGKYLLPAERAAKEQPSSKSIVQLLDEIRADEKLNVAAHWDDGNKIRDGIIPRAGEEMVHYAAQVHVTPDELERKTAEMTNAVCLYTAAAQHPPNMVMWDFYFMHCVNASIFFPAFNKLPFLTPAHKSRLLEWKIRMDIAMYASRRCPPILLDEEIRAYRPKQPSHWDGIADRVCNFYDDGHAAKLIRALAHGQRICQPYEDREEFRVKHDDWLQMGHMAIDSVENTRRFESVSTWVRSAGFEEAWEKIPLRAQL